MDTSKIKFNDLPRLAPNNDPITSAHDALNPGPERSQYDVQRHEQFKLHYPKRVLMTRNRLPDLRCNKCQQTITSGGVTLNGIHWCGGCLSARS